MAPAALPFFAPGFGGGQEISSELLAWLGLALSILGGVVLLADLVLLWLYALGRYRDKPLLAPRWSVADIFLGLQIFLWLTGTGATLILTPVAFLSTSASQDASARLMSATMLLIIVVQNLALAATVWLFVEGKYGAQLAEAGLSLRAWRRGLLLGLLAAVLTLPVTDFLDQVARSAIAAAPSSPVVRLALEMTKLVDVQALLEPLLTPEWLGVLILVIGIVGPLGEEIFFRGFAYTALKKRWGVGWAMTLSALLFSLIHANPLAAIPIFLIGLLLAYLYERTGTLAAPFALHAANNTAAILLMYFAPNFSLWRWLFPPGG